MSCQYEEPTFSGEDLLAFKLLVKLKKRMNIQKHDNSLCKRFGQIQNDFNLICFQFATVCFDLQLLTFVGKQTKQHLEDKQQKHV